VGSFHGAVKVKTAHFKLIDAPVVRGREIISNIIGREKGFP